MKFSEAESIRLSLLSLRADKGDVLTDENYADIAKWKAAIAHSQAPIKNILIEAVKDETKDVLTDAYFTAANKFYIAVSTEYKNGAVSDASMNIRGIIRALDESSFCKRRRHNIQAYDYVETGIKNLCNRR